MRFWCSLQFMASRQGVGGLRGQNITRRHHGETLSATTTRYHVMSEGHLAYHFEMKERVRDQLDYFEEENAPTISPSVHVPFHPTLVGHKAFQPPSNDETWRALTSDVRVMDSGRVLKNSIDPRKPKANTILELTGIRLLCLCTLSKSSPELTKMLTGSLIP